MKKLPLLFIFVFVVTCAFGQDEGVEIFVGGSSSTLRGDVEGNLSRRVSIHGGALFLMPIDDKFRIKVGFAYAGRGASQEGEDVKLGYIELPLLLSYGSEKFDFFIGPQAALLISSNLSPDKPRDFGLKYGVSVGLSNNVFARVFFYHGFSNIVDYPGVDVTNRYISLVFGYRFGSQKTE